MNNNFQSKYNLGQKMAESIFEDITTAFNYLEKGQFDRSFNKFKTIKGKIPINKIRVSSKKIFKSLDLYYSKAHTIKKNKLLYKIIVKYSEILISELDKNSMYLPSLRDTSNFT